MKKFIPKVEHIRHQRHVGAFVLCTHAYQLSTLISKYIYDPEISPLNDDDLDLFKTFLFDNGTNDIHIRYYADQLVRPILSNRKKRIKAIRKICRYSEFLNRINTLMTIDLFHHVFRLRDDMVVAEEIFNGITPYTRIIFVRTALNYTPIINRIPKLKLYVTFS